MPNAYVDLGRLKDSKTGLNINATSADELLLQMAEAASRHIDEATDRRFYVEVATKYYDGVKPRNQLNVWDRLPEYKSNLTGQTSDAQLWLPAGDDLLSVTTLKLDEDGDRTYELTLAAATDYYLWPDNTNPKIRIDLDRANGQRTTWGYGRQRVQIVGTWGYSNDRVTVSSALNEALDVSETEVNVIDGSKYAIGQTIRIDSEDMYITGLNFNTLTVERAVNGATAAAHDNAATIQRYRYPSQITLVAFMQVSRWWRRKDDGFANVKSSPETGSVTIWRGLDPDIEDMLAAFKTFEGVG